MLPNPACPGESFTGNPLPPPLPLQTQTDECGPFQWENMTPPSQRHTPLVTRVCVCLGCQLCARAQGCPLLASKAGSLAPRGPDSELNADSSSGPPALLASV